MSQVCRTCLGVFDNGCQLFSLEINEPALGTVHVKTKLEACVPEIDLNRVRNSAICRYCLFALNTAYDFKTKCIQSENRLFKHMIGDTIDSTDLCHFLRQNTNHLVSCDRANQISEINGESRTVPQLSRPPLPFQAVPPLPAAPTLPHYSQYSAGPSVYRGTLIEYGAPPRSLPARPLLPPNPFFYTHSTIPSRPYLSTDTVSLPSRPTLSEGPLSSRSCATTGSLLPPPPPPPPHSSMSRIDIPLPPGQLQVTDPSISSRPPVSAGSVPLEDSSLSLRACLASQPFLPNPQFVTRTSLPPESHLSSGPLITMRLPSPSPTGSLLPAGPPLLDGPLRGPPRAPLPPRSYFVRPPLFNSVINNNPQHTISYRPPATSNNTFILISNVTNPFSYKCSVCQQCFTSNDLLNRHMSCHINPEGLKCSMCDFQTNSTVSLDEHLKSHSMLTPIEQYSLPAPMDVSSPELASSTAEKPSSAEPSTAPVGEALHHCGLCNFKTSHSSSLRRHMKVHMGSRPYRCTECRYGAADEVTLQTHMKVHFKKRPYKCNQCPFAALKNNKLRSHMEKIHGVVVGPFEANVENEDQSSDGSLAVDPYHVTMADIQSILQEEDDDSSNPVENSVAGVTVDPMEADSEVDRADPYMITVEDIKTILEGNDSDMVENEECGVLNSENRQIQNEQDTSSGKVFRCGMCREQFKYLYLYKRHMNIHSTSHKTQLACTKCDFRTTIKSHLQVHMKTHTGGKFYQCEKCAYSTIYWSNFQKHKRVHTGERPFKCPFCDYRASQHTSLKSHMNTHPENTVYKCKECPYSANTEEALLSHVEMHSIGGHFMEDGLSNNFIAESIKRHFTLNNLGNDSIRDASPDNFIQTASNNDSVQDASDSHLTEDAPDNQCNQEFSSSNDLESAQNDGRIHEVDGSCEGSIQDASGSDVNFVEQPQNDGFAQANADLSQQASSSVVQELSNNHLTGDFHGLSDSGIGSLCESSNPNNDSIQGVSDFTHSNNSGWEASSDLTQGLSNSNGSNPSDIVQEVSNLGNGSIRKSSNFNNDFIDEVCNSNPNCNSNSNVLDNLFQKSSNTDASNPNNDVVQVELNLSNNPLWKSGNYSNDFIGEISSSGHNNDISQELLNNGAPNSSNDLIQEVSNLNNDSTCKPSDSINDLMGAVSDHVGDFNRGASNLIQESLHNDAVNPNDVIQEVLNFNNDSDWKASNSSNDPVEEVSYLDHNDGFNQEVSNTLIQESSNNDISYPKDDVIQEVSDLINDSFWKSENSNNNLLHEVSSANYSSDLNQDAANCLIQELDSDALNPNDAIQGMSSHNDDSGWKSISGNDFIPEVFSSRNESGVY